MIHEHFDRAFAYLLGSEGGFSDHPADSGGATKYGITRATLARWRDLPIDLMTADHVHTLTREEAKEIYWVWYWLPLHCSDIENLAVATVIFDAAVLFGVRIASVYTQRVLQNSIPEIAADGSIGAKTLAALNRGNANWFILQFNALLLVRISGLVRDYPKNEVFQNGWTKRVNKYLTLIT